MEKQALCYDALMSITISKAEINKKEGVVILPLKEYKQLLKRAVPEYYFTGKAAKRLDKLVEQGLRDYHAGKTRKIRSLADLD